MSEDKKYELIPTTSSKGQYRIRALIDIPRYGIKAGDGGGFVDNENNLSQYGECWIMFHARVTGEARVWGDALITDTAIVRGKATVRGQALIAGKSLIQGNAVVDDHARIDGSAIVRDKATVRGQARITASAIVGDAAIVGNNATVKGSAVITRFALVRQPMFITGSAAISKPEHVLFLSFNTAPDTTVDLHLYRTMSGNHSITIGSWRGTLEELQGIAQSQKYPTSWAIEDAQTYGPLIRAIADVCAARISTWGDKDV